MDSLAPMTLAGNVLPHWYPVMHINGLTQDCSNSIANCHMRILHNGQSTDLLYIEKQLLANMPAVVIPILSDI